MKRITLPILAVLLILGLSVKGAASPTPTRCRMMVYVPFAFQIVGRTFPAGYYRFEQVTGSSDGVEVLVVRSMERPEFYQAVATKVERMDQTQTASKIVFRRSGKHLVFVELCSSKKHAALELYNPVTNEPAMITSAQGDDDVVLPVPSEGEVLAMARPTR